MTNIPRPQWNHECVQSAAADYVFESVKDWAISMGVFDADQHSEAELRAVTHLCIMQSADCYEAARYFDSFCGWPSNGELALILDRAYSAMKTLTAPFVHEWVMANEVRFPAKEGDDIKINIGGAEFTAKCVGVIAREARGFAELRTGDTVPVLAEEVAQVFKTKRSTSGTPTPPTGGTPIAPRGGALLKANAA